MLRIMFQKAIVWDSVLKPNSAKFHIERFVIPLEQNVHMREQHMNVWYTSYHMKSTAWNMNVCYIAYYKYYFNHWRVLHNISRVLL
jgi:hypothetical protein